MAFFVDGPIRLCLCFWLECQADVSYSFFIVSFAMKLGSHKEMSYHLTRLKSRYCAEI